MCEACLYRCAVSYSTFMSHVSISNFHIAVRMIEGYAKPYKRMFCIPAMFLTKDVWYGLVTSNLEADGFIRV
jgi:hypothetical protein